MPIIDPTANVTALVHAEAKRQDDLRTAETKRIDDLRQAEMRRTDGQIEAVRGSIEIVREELDKRLKAIEDVRAQVQEQTTLMATKENVDFVVKSLDARVNKFENIQAIISGQQTGKSMATGSAVAVAAVVLAIIGLIVTVILRTG